MFGKILRIDPLGSNSANGQYGIPERNPFTIDDSSETLGEIYAYGLRNPQHLAWDRRTGRMFVTDIGQGTVEELNTLGAGDNLGWNLWEGSFRFEDGRGGVSTENPRSDHRVTYPIAEYDQTDPVLGNRVAVTGLAVYRATEIAQLTGHVLFGDLPSGEMFAVPSDHLPMGGQGAIRRVLFDDNDEAKTFLELLQQKTAEQGRELPTRADLCFHSGNEGRIYLLNKADGVIRVLVP